MPERISVVIPVKDGARYLGEVLAALAREPIQQVLVVDSGSTDGSMDIARAAGVEMLEVPPDAFGHGRTRNLGAERTDGGLIAFLTQDATPCPGWADAWREAFALDPAVGAAYGPHLPRTETPPMVARELETFFAGFSPDRRPVVQGAEGPVFLSNVNACYRRSCWESVRFDDVPYAEDQAFARAMLAAGWKKVYHPGAAVLHAHDYPLRGFLRRYFDEYRGLREALGHVEPFGVRSVVRDVRGLVAADRAWMTERGMPARERAHWTRRAVLHHGGRKVFSALGSRADRLPQPVRAAISLEGRGDPGVAARPPTGQLQPARGGTAYDAIDRFLTQGPSNLLPVSPGSAERPHLRVAVVIPYFRRGSGGHNSIFQIVRWLERMGHVVTLWVHDPQGYHRSEGPAVIRRNIREWFAPIDAPVSKDLSAFPGADVALATGWETVYPVMRLPRVRARAYLVHDYESGFFPASAESRWAEDTFRLGLFAICSSPWLAQIVRDRHKGDASTFQFGVDHETYYPRPVDRDAETVIFYGRAVTPRRAVPLGVLALAELHRRRPSTRIRIFGDIEPLRTPFPHEHLGVVTPTQLAWAYSQATVGLCLSLTNYSLIPQEMLACGLPCVDLAGVSAESVFGADGPVELAPFHPVALADAIERLLDDPSRWQRRSQAGKEFVAGHTWEAAARQVEAGLRHALRTSPGTSL